MTAGESRSPGPIAVAAILATTGCAGAIRSAWPSDSTPEKVAAEYVPVPEGLQVKVTNLGRPNTLFGIGYGDLAGITIDLVAGINLPLLLPYRDAGSAYLTSALVAGSLVGSDAALSGQAWQKALAPPVWTLRVGAGPDRRDLALRGAGSNLVVTVPLSETERTEALTFGVVDAGGQVLFSEIKQFPDLAWGTATRVAIAAPEERPIDVDEPPAALPPQASSAAVIIGIERYGDRIPGAPYAERDAAVFRTYALNVMRVPEENILFLANDKATKGAIETAIEAQLPAIVTAGKSDVYVYYAGHGAPEVEEKAPYIVPYDGNPDFPGKSCYGLDALYGAVGKMGARSVTVFLDACFTGSAGRADTPVGLFADSRPLFIAPVMGALPPGVNVLAASNGT